MTADRAKWPVGNDWRLVQDQVLTTSGVVDSAAWQSGPVRVISALEIADYPDGNGSGPQWHVSVSGPRRRPKPHEVRRALRAFGMADAEEDNHHAGNARHFWIPLDEAHRVDCECKTSERTIVEPDGYTFTTPVDGPCRGCELGPITGRTCPIHGAGVSP